MTRRTRRLISLIAEDSTAEVLQALRAGPKTRRDLEDATGLGRTRLGELLEQLFSHGLVDCTRLRTGQRGRPKEQWSLTAASALDDFEGAATKLRQTLLRRQLEEERDE